MPYRLAIAQKIRQDRKISCLPPAQNRICRIRTAPQHPKCRVLPLHHILCIWEPKLPKRKGGQKKIKIRKWTLPESNQRRADLQSAALPTELRVHTGIEGFEPPPQESKSCELTICSIPQNSPITSQVQSNNI